MLRTSPRWKNFVKRLPTRNSRSLQETLRACFASRHSALRRFSCIFPTTHAHVLRPICRLLRALASQRSAGTAASRPRRKLHLRRTSPHGRIRRPLDHRKRLPRGSRLAILADNHPRWVAAYLGIIASGCATVPLDTALHADQVTKLLKDSGTSAVFCDAKHVPVARPGATELNLGLILMDPDRMTNPSIHERWLGTLPAIFDAGPGKFKPAPANDHDLASLLYTSGTTADPKGVMLTHANFLGEVEAVFNWIDLGPSDALLGVLPLFHVLAQMANLLLPLVKGSRVVYLETLNTTELMRALSERNITAFAVVPQFFYLIHERVFQEIGKRGAVTRKIFAAIVSLNRALRKVGIDLRARSCFVRSTTRWDRRCATSPPADRASTPRLPGIFTISELTCCRPMA